MRWKTDRYTGWGRALAATGRLARPERHRHLDALPSAPAIGMRRSYGDAALNTSGDVIDMTRLDRIIRFDTESGVIDVEAGITLGDLLRVTAPRGWMPAVLPGTGYATVGGAIGNDVHGKNHHAAGSFGQHLLGIELLINGARHHVTPGTDLFKATVGGLGQTGIVTRATLQLSPCPGTAMQVHERRIAHWDDFIDALNASDAPYCVGWLDAQAHGPALGRGILEEATLSATDLSLPDGGPKVPLTPPRWAMSGPVVRLFNAWYYRRVPAAGRRLTRPLAAFFFPLDRVHDWNRLYGAGGFHQFQCVVPRQATSELREMMQMISDSGLASPLAVLKRMGDGRAGWMSFPIEGYTLAVDFQASTKSEALIRQLIQRVAAANGRIYLAKDSLAAPDDIRAMYPDHTDWATVVDDVDPDQNLRTDLIRRLNLREPT